MQTELFHISPTFHLKEDKSFYIVHHIVVTKFSPITMFKYFMYCIIIKISSFPTQKSIISQIFW